jgi:hypothetical protein
MMSPETAHGSKEDFTTGSPLYKLWWGDRLREGRSTPSNAELPPQFNFLMSTALLNECANFWVKKVGTWQAKPDSKDSKRSRGCAGVGGGSGSASSTNTTPSKRPRTNSFGYSTSSSPAQTERSVPSPESVLLKALDEQTEKITTAMNNNASQMAEAMRLGLQAIANSLNQ